jgi:acyl-CoA synthetase (AMP-forming)/AMP-acid ligase II
MPFASPHPDVEIPDVGLVEYVLGDAARHGARPALVDGSTGRSLTYDQLAAAVRANAASLAAHGLAKGDVVAIVAPNCPEYAIALYATCSLGGVVTTVNPLLTAHELAAQLADAGVRFVLAGPEHEEHVRAAAPGIPVLPLADAREPGPPPPDVRIEAGSDLALLPYSSGTTGLPKGVMLTHRNLVANLAQIAAFNRLGPGERVLGALPFFHITGLQLLLSFSLARGATVITMPRFELGRFLELVEAHRVTRMFVVPPIVLALTKDPAVGRHDLSSLRALFCGAAPLSPDIRAACERRIGCPVLQGYGLTETSPIVSSRVEGASGDAATSAGPPVPSTELRIVDVATGRDLPAGDPGEVWVRGPQVMRGYRNRPAETAEVLTEEGWLRTGDIGRVDERGELHLVDRLKELIKYKAYQVAPAELEAVLVAHPAVADVAVIPSPDPEAGEVPKALVVAREAVDPDVLLAFVAERVAPYKKVRRLELVDEIPKAPSGKILRRVLVERERER